MYMYKYWFQLWRAWRCIQAQPFLCAWMLLSCRWHCQAYWFFVALLEALRTEFLWSMMLEGKFDIEMRSLRATHLFFIWKRGRSSHSPWHPLTVLCDFAPVPVPMEGLPQWQWRGTRPCESVWFQDISSLLFEKRLSPIRAAHPQWSRYIMISWY